MDNRCLMVNGHEYKLMMNYMKLGDLQYNSEKDRDEIIRSIEDEYIYSTNNNTESDESEESDESDEYTESDEYIESDESENDFKEASTKSIIDQYEQSIHITDILNDFENYLKAPSKYEKNDKLKIDDITNIFSVIGIDTSTDLVKNYLLNYTNSLFCYGTKVLENTEYDAKLREWLGNDYKWKLLYRASEHEYSAESFHDYCDDKGPTLIVIKSSEGYIFGGYTTQSWSEKCIY